MLFEQHKDPMAIMKILLQNMRLGINVQPFIISDYYFAAMAIQSPHEHFLHFAIKIHKGLGNITIGGKDAAKYPLQELAQLGEEEHNKLFKTIEPRFRNGEFDLTKKELGILFQ